jgi:hypothetical protein
MARYNPIRNTFTSGEVSPRLEARTDLRQYFQGLRQTLNGLVVPHGGFNKRSGTRFTGEVKDSADNTRLIPFRFSTDVAYVIEHGDEYMRFYINDGRLESGGTPVEVTSPFKSDEIEQVQFAQEADVMYMVHSNHPPHILSRTSISSFSMDEVVFRDGKAPLRPSNLASNDLTVTGAGPYTLNWASDPTPAGLASGTDVGRAVRFTDGTDTAWFKISSVTNSSEAVASLESGTIPAAAGSDWALGAFSDTEGPYTVVLHEGRLAYGGTPTAPDRVWLSVSDDFNNFELEDPGATSAENADKAISRRMVSSEVNTIRWLVSANRRLVVGTSGDEFFVQGENEDFLTPAGAVVRQVTSRGSAFIVPVQIDNKTIFVQRQATKLRKLVFNLESDDFVASELSILAEHITRSGVKELVYQQDPDSIVWTVLNDGRLIGWTLEQEQEVIAAHRHIIGGEFKQTAAKVESVAVVPQTETGGRDRLWLIAKRTIGGSTVRYVEFMEDAFEPAVDFASSDLERIREQENGFFVDSGLSLDNPIAIDDISNANPAVVTTTVAHGLSTGDRVRVRDVIGMPEVNMRSFFITVLTATTFELDSEDSSTHGTYAQGGTVRQEFNGLANLDHLIGEEVQILADGGPHPNRVVDGSGEVVLEKYASIVHIGYGYDFRGETTRMAAGGEIGPSTQGQQYRIQRVSVRLLNTLGLQVGVGPNPAELERINFRDGSHAMSRPPPMFTGDKEVPVAGGWTTEPTVYFQQNQPLPAFILAVLPRAEFNER